MKEIKNGKYVETTRTAWYLNNQLHRMDGPAVQYHSLDRKGQEDWYMNGKYHREDGPARISKNGDKQWYINGIQYTEEHFNQWLDKKNLNEKLEKTLEKKAVIKRNKI